MPVRRGQRSGLAPVVAAAVLSAVLAAAWLVFAPRTPDLAAQAFRTWLFEEHGFAVVNLQWYGGHHVLGYSLLFPPLGALLTERVAGALAAVASAALFAALAHRHFGDRARAGVLLFAAGTTAELLIGRLTFVLGTAFALASLLALQRDRRALAVVLAVATTAASPVAALFLALAALAAGSVAVLVAAFGSAVALALAFPTGGTQSWGGTSFALVLAATVLVAVLLPREQRTLRRGAVLYGLAAIAAFLVATPMGSNATRLAAVLAAPVLVASLAHARRPIPLIAAAALPLLAYQWWGPVREVAKHDASAGAAYHAPLLRALERAGASRVEVPFTRLHWESFHVARHTPLARGWEAQLDRDRNPLFYDEPLTAERYRRWLARNAVSHVALPDVALDPAGKAEGALVARGLPYLREVWRNEHWRLFAVRGARPVGTEDATPTSFTVALPESGRRRVAIAFSRYWRADDPRARVCESGDGRLAVIGDRSRRVRITTNVSAETLLRSGPRCSAG